MIITTLVSYLGHLQSRYNLRVAGIIPAGLYLHHHLSCCFIVVIVCIVVPKIAGNS